MKTSFDTIAAQATPPGRGGVGIIRVSGPEVLSIIQKILGKTILPKQASFSKFLSDKKQVIDEGVAIYFSGPSSFTGEDVLELQGHGGQVVMDLLLQRVLELGARLAEPGEFIKRAFLNGKLDLSQVEAVSDLINAATTQAAQYATRSLQGKFSEKINKIVEDLTQLRVELESTIDFADDQGAGDFDENNLQKQTQSILSQVEATILIAKQGIILREGVQIVIAGDPNVGKSSLLNFFSGQDTAIVADIPGTTRDILRVWVELDGVPIHFLDTAGLHDQPEMIEAEGIRRAKREIEQADHVLLMIDAAKNPNGDLDRLSLELKQIISKEKPLTVICNKIDLIDKESEVIEQKNITKIYLSVKTGEGLEQLKKHLKGKIGFKQSANGFSARNRHLDSLIQAEKYLNNIKNLIVEKRIELIAEELKLVQNVLGEITGLVTAADLLDKIFSEFCIGK